METLRKTRKRLIVNIPEEFHRDIKKRALFRGMNMTSYIFQAIMEKISREKKYE